MIDDADEVEYREELHGVGPGQVAGFFEGWPNPPSPQRFVQALSAASHVVLAWHRDRIIGFVTANSDGMNASIPLLEVLAQARGRGIGSRLVRRMLERLSDHYAVDVVCDQQLVAFYERFDLRPIHAMVRRTPANLDVQTAQAVATPTLKADRLLLRAAVSRDDDQVVLDAINDPEIHRWIPAIAHPYTIEDARDFHRRVLLDAGDPASHQWYIRDPDTAAILGAIGLHHRGPGTAEIGYWVTRPARGRGIAPTAVRTVVAWAFEHLDDLVRIQLRADAANQASQRVAEKAGFTKEGVLRAYEPNTQGGRRDIIWYARLRSDTA